MIQKNNKLIYFNFAELLPEDNYFFNHFETDCLASGYDRALINWGGSFPWNFDDRLSLVEHIHEKAVTALSDRIKNSSFSILPVFPLIGGMDFLLSFPSYCHLRLDEYCNALNVESAGALLLLNEIIDDYTSLACNTDEAAFNLTAVSSLNNEKRINKTADVISSLLVSNPQFRSIYLVGYKKDLILIEKIKKNINFKNMAVLFINDYPEYMNSDNSGKGDLTTAGPIFFLPDNVKQLMTGYNLDIKYAWDLLKYLKSGLYKIKYSLTIPYYEFSTLSVCNSELVDIFSKIVKTTGIIKKNLDGRLNKNNINLYFDSATGIIKKEIMLIKYDMENIKSKIRGDF